MPPASTIGPSKNSRTARTNTNGLSQPVWPPGAGRQQHQPVGAGGDRALGVADRGDIGEHQRAGIMQRRQHRRRRADRGDDDLGPVPQQHLQDPAAAAHWSGARSGSGRSAPQVCRLRRHAAAAGLRSRPASRRVARALRQFTVGNEPITPLRQAATTRSTPETRNIGAAISGRLRRSRKRERDRGLRWQSVSSRLEQQRCCASVAANIGTIEGR